MKEQVAIQKLLHKKLAELQTRNPNFSRRAFSKRLGLSAGAISELFNGQRRASMKLAKRIASKLALDPQERADLFSAFPEQKTKALKLSSENDLKYLKLSADQFHVIGEWFHFAVLALMRTKTFKSEIGWIAERLSLPKSTVQGAIERLKRVGLIKEVSDGSLARSKTRYRTSDDIANASIQKAHGQYIEKAKDALNKIPVESRDFTSLMMAINPEKLTLAKEKIRKFQDELAADLEVSPQTEVYQLCIHLFPLTNREEIKK